MIGLEKLRDYAKDPARIAAVWHGEQMTYCQMYQYIKAIRVELKQRLGFNKRGPIMYIGDKENLYLAALFAGLMSGYPYVAVSSAYPEQKIREMAELCNPVAVFQFQDQQLEPFCDAWYTLEKLKEITEQETDEEMVPPCYDWANDELFAIFFTSGSTGTPKGVRITYRNIEVNVERRAFLGKHYDLFPRGAETRILNFSSYGFVASIPMLFDDILEHGASVYAIDRELLSDYKQLMTYIRQINPDRFTCTPSFLDICLKNQEFCREKLSNLRLVFSGGGPLSMEIVRAFRKRFDAELINAYGITETTSMNMYFPVSELQDDNGELCPSGYPFPGEQASVMDEDEREVNDGEIGELYVISDGVCCGYLNSSDDAFFITEEGKRGYRTRDMYRKENGVLYYLGRKDNMVKVGNYRVELFGVEAVMRGLSEIMDCIVIPCKEDGIVKLLAAYVVPGDGTVPGLATTIAIKRQLRSLLQSYAVPQIIHYIDSIPVNLNHKPDRMGLEKKIEEELFGQ